MEPITDILNFSHVKQIVDQQYAQLLANEATNKHFSHLNLEAHLPRIYNFWCFILDVDAANHSYKGSAFEPHAKLGLQNIDFEIWQQCLQNAVKSNFIGEKANLMLEKASQLGLMFQYKLGLISFDS